MLVSQRPKAVLLLADGTRFDGRAIGAIGTTVGEICFNTGMTGYQEIFTDPSYTGQIVTLASPHIGNYGVKDGEEESTRVTIAGLVVKKFSEVWSRPGGTSSLDDHLKAHGIVGISDVDTRKLVRHIRDHGACNAVIDSSGMSDDALEATLAAAPDMAGLELSSKVSTKEPYLAGDPQATYRVALLDCGIKLNSIRNLVVRGCLVKVFPMSSTIAQMMEWKPSGFLLSNGPGDPGAMPKTVELVRSILDAGLPVFGICLGHQLLAQCHGVGTLKMHHGHRGINHPVKNLVTGRDEVTSQNHGFVVDRKQVESHSELEVTHLHINDGTLAGFRVKGRPVFSVQYHPEAGPGPYDSRYLFDDFIENMAVAAQVKEGRAEHA